jgi:hypothetical protein
MAKQTPDPHTTREGERLANDYCGKNEEQRETSASQPDAWIAFECGSPCLRGGPALQSDTRII